MEPTKDLPLPVKGKADWRTYKAFQLENGVTCLVIHDKESKTTGMSCVVNVGASSDPRELSGLAHFCEHMCFLGSEKYPGENEYKRYLSSHGGRSNASTSMHCTNYKFEVLADHAETAVDIFSNFFVAPLFTASGTSREVQAVDSENSKNLTADSRRRLQVLKDLADPNHYYSKFSTGNAKTLNTSDPQQLEWIRSALLAFHKKHYHPENMTVVLAGPQSLDTLKEWLVSRFSQIPKSSAGNELESQQKTEMEEVINTAASEAPANSIHLPPPPFQSAFVPSLQGGTWPVMLTTKPLRSMRKLVLMWPVPSTDKRFPDQSASSLLSHLLGHEGEGSIFAVLQNHGLVSSLSAGPRTRSPDFTLFQIDMGLTEKGEGRWQEVVDLVFGYCRTLQHQARIAQQNQNSELHRIWDEMSKLDQLFFHQTSPGGVYSCAPNLAERVLSYGTEKVLSAGSMLEEHKGTLPHEKILAMANLLEPSNCIVERCSDLAWKEANLPSQIDSEADETNGIFGTKTEPWYGVEYNLSKIKSDTIACWKGESTMPSEASISELSLPRPNRYIPRTLDLCKDLPDEAKIGPRLEKPIEPPILLVNNEMGRLFHRLDDRYALPQSSLNFLIRNPAVQYLKNQSAKSGDQWEYSGRASLLSSLLSGCFNEAMAQETYDADLAGLYWSLTIGNDGIRLTSFGFSDRLPELAKTILAEFYSGKFLKASHFESTKDRVIRGLETYFSSRRTDAHAVYYRDALLASKDNGIEESLRFAQEAELESAKEHFQTLVQSSEISLECLFMGNVSKQTAKGFYEEASKIIKTAQKAPDMTMVREKKSLPAGFVERQVLSGQEIELHFASKNPEEENGAVICSYQSSIPSFRGDAMSTPADLLSSATIRLICHMLREPLFNDLRTKQQLGYIVSAYYEQGFSSRQNDELQKLGPMTMPVDFMTVVVLSRKLSPPDIARRIDEFMVGFREILLSMPESEIRDHADALSTKLLKPIPKLQTEASKQFSRIKNFAPELFHLNSPQLRAVKGPEERLPWDATQSMAAAIKQLNRNDLVETWDRMTQAASRSRILSCVYGKTFPLDESRISVSAAQRWQSTPTLKIVNRFSDILQLRTRLPYFGNQHRQKRDLSSWTAKGALVPLSRWNMVGLGCAFGVGVIGLGMAIRSQKRAQQR